MADWNDGSSPKPKGCGSNPVIDNLEYNNILWVEKKLIKIVRNLLPFNFVFTMSTLN